MITAAETTTALRLIESMLGHHDDHDHPGSRAHLTAARTQLKAVIKLQPIDPD